MRQRLLGLIVASLAAFFGSAYFLNADETAKEKPMEGRIYELRTYTTFPGKLPALHKRFRDHTLKLFEKHGMKNGMYWTPTDPEKSQNTLIYVVSHDSIDAAKKSWAGFRTDPDWIKARDASEADGKIVEKVESVYMTLAEFSPVK
jgi:hypothetical protein